MRVISVSEEQVASYQRDGAVLIPGFLGEEELALLEAGLEESYANPGKRHSRARGVDGEGETFLETFPSLGSTSLARLLGVGRVPALAARLMQAPSAQLVLDQVFYKQRGTVNPTPWHQDTPYLRVRGDQMIRVWVSCDFVPAGLALQLVRGSHRWNVVFNGRPPGSENSLVTDGDRGRMFSYKNEEGNAGPTMPDIERYRDSFDILNWEVAPGDALVFNGNMLHAAGGAEHCVSPRRAYASLWGGPDLIYADPPENAIPTLADVNGHKVPNGSRLGDYPEAFPVGWAAQG